MFRVLHHLGMVHLSFTGLCIRPNIVFLGILFSYIEYMSIICACSASSRVLPHILLDIVLLALDGGGQYIFHVRKLVVLCWFTETRLIVQWWIAKTPISFGHFGSIILSFGIIFFFLQDPPPLPLSPHTQNTLFLNLWVKLFYRRN